MANFVKQLSGCKRECTVWKYFEEQANIRKSKNVWYRMRKVG